MSKAALSLTTAPLSDDPGQHPRPQLRRAANRRQSLDGTWSFATDDSDVGRRDRWFSSLQGRDPFTSPIVVPFPPESDASGIGDRGIHPVVWYRRPIDATSLAIETGRTLLHFGAVDYRADVWLDGRYLGGHEGGSTPFRFDVTQILADSTGPVELVVRAEDDPHDMAQPRGKQEWRPQPHGIWYERTTGIWQPVWLEHVPDLHVEHLTWAPEAEAGTVTLHLDLDRRPPAGTRVRVQLTLEGDVLADASFAVNERQNTNVLTLARHANGQEQTWLLWSPEAPRLIEATIELEAPGYEPDVLSSYFGLRSVGWRDGHFMLNDRPYYLRAVLEQGYWPLSHLSAPSADALRREVQLIKDLGFNTARVHQKVEDPRFLYWADRLGLLIWGENASAYAYSTTAVERMSTEWAAVIRRDSSHPCIVTWVPLNESWGVQQIAHSPAQLDYAQALYHLTKALDPSRPVVSNDGWEHADSDIWTVHDYGITHDELAANYTNRAVVDGLLGGIGPLGRRMRLLDRPDRGQPVVVSEFGGVSYAPSGSGDAWGYTSATNPEQFEHLLRELFQALQSSPVLAGFCYTQLTDTRQEANGLTDADRVPKIPAEVIRSIVQGDGVDTSGHRRPKQPSEQPHPGSPVPDASEPQNHVHFEDRHQEVSR
ncbi:glycoside hydrolase family 2 TIM barrel-domain containing protein [Microbacterium sp. X-17]|uniref:glycoside hydrolase family 2 protein n=1 Tax=Microbacterium sp. X-17 TaxID=3144404 RepID=UPI0031F545A7